MRNEKLGMRNVKRVTFLMAIVCLLCITNCPFNTRPIDDETPIPAGMGRVTLRLADSVGRTILPSTTPALSYFDAGYEVTFATVTDPTGTPSVGTEVTVTHTVNGSTLTANVDPGWYQIKVYAYREVDGANMLAAIGASDFVEIVADTPAIVSIKLRMALGEAGTEGYFSWNITAPAYVNSISMTIEGVAAYTNFDISSNRNNTTTPVTLDSDAYNVIFTLQERDEDAEPDPVKEEAVWYELLHVYSTLTSTYTKTFTDAYFKTKNYVVTFNYNWPVGSTPTSKKQSVLPGDSITMVAPGTAQEPTGYKFVEWNTQANGNGTGYEDSDSYTPLTDNTTLYAIWELIKGTVNITLTIDPLGDISASDTTITLSKSAATTTQTITISNGDDFSSLAWRIGYTGTSTSITANASGDYEFTINANNISLGPNQLIISGEKDGNAFAVNILVVITP